MMTEYSNALTEVYVILNSLSSEEFAKIPEATIKVIKEDMNPDYKYELDNEKDLKDCQISIDAKRILFNLFEDYLATSEQREKIKKIEFQERERAEEIKREKYGIDIFEAKSSKEIKKQEENDINQLVVIEKENFIMKIINKIRIFFFNK